MQYTASGGMTMGGTSDTSFTTVNAPGISTNTVFKERDQNPVENDIIRLRLYTFNSNLPVDIYQFNTVETYLLDKNSITEENRDGRILIESLNVQWIVHEGTGSYFIDIPHEPLSTTGDPVPLVYSIGNYIDVWSFTPDPSRDAQTIENHFKIWPSLWYSSPTPIIYDWTFFFRPNRIRKGSRQNILVEAHSNAPRATEMEAYYVNLASAMANLNSNNGNDTFTVTMEQKCGYCLPAERDLRIVLEDAPIMYRGNDGYGYFFLDTTDMEPGVYSLTFTLNMGGNTFVSPEENFQIYV